MLKFQFNPAYIIILSAILTASWPDNTTTHTPATTLETCQDAARAYQRGIGLPQDQSQPPITIYCIYAAPDQAGFKPGWDCISGYNCK